MNHLQVALWAEYMKIRKSRIFWITLFIFVFIPLMMGLMIYIVRHPEISAKLGIVAVKASLFGDADWPAFLGLINQAVATVGFIGFGFVTTWVYGREHTDRTMKDILTLPVSRTSIVLAKTIIVILWCTMLSLVMIITALLLGKAMAIQGFSQQVLSDGLSKYAITSGLTMLLTTPVAFFAGYGRGLIAPLGFVIITLIMAQFVALSGLGAFFPWSVPGLFTAPEGTEGMQLYPSSYIILAATFLLGLLATVSWWKRADHH